MILTIFSPKTSPREPPKTVKSWAKTHDRPAVDGAEAGDDAVAVRPLLAHPEVGRAVPGERVGLDEASPRRAAARSARGRSACRARAGRRRPCWIRRGPPRRPCAAAGRACPPWCAGRAGPDRASGRLRAVRRPQGLLGTVRARQVRSVATCPTASATSTARRSPRPPSAGRWCGTARRGRRSSCVSRPAPRTPTWSPPPATGPRSPARCSSSRSRPRDGVGWPVRG